MFGIWHRKQLKEGAYWYVLVPDFDTSTDDFYQLVHTSIEKRRLPDLEISEKEFREGGALSARRRYLRMRRDRLVFDVCSAPFGTSWFFSCRSGEIPMRLRWWETAVILGAAAGLLAAHVLVLGISWGATVFILNALSFLFLLNALVATELYGLDAALTRVPVLGAFYDTYFRGDSYHRDDTRRMYLVSVDRLVRDAVEQTSGTRPENWSDFHEEFPSPGLWARIREALRRVG